MTLLDCADAESAIKSLADASGVQGSELIEAIKGADIGEIGESSEMPVSRRMPAEVLSRLGLTLEGAVSRLSGAFYYHASRSLNPDLYRSDGLVPLVLCIDGIWEALRLLTDPLVPMDRWYKYRSAIEDSRSLSQAAFLYRLKLESPDTGGGPFARLVRDVHLFPRPPERDYLRNPPEIVEDIIASLPRNIGSQLEESFYEASKACLVRFTSSQVTSVEVESALWYLYDSMSGSRPGGWAAQGGFSGAGVEIPADQIVDVEIVTFD